MKYSATIKKLGMTPPAAGRVLGISRRHAQRFAKGYELSAPVRKLLRVMEEYKVDPQKVEGF